MAISYKNYTVYFTFANGKLINIAVALNLERLYNKTSDFGIDYEKGCQISTDFDKCTLYNTHVTTSKYIAKM